MSRVKKSEFVLRVNLKSDGDVRRFCEVHVDRDDNVYVFQPRKGKSVKVSYHESGQRHTKIGDGPALFVMRLDPTQWIKSQEDVWSKSFENFSKLLPYKGENADEILMFDLPRIPYTNTITFAQVSIGRFFETKGWSEDGVRMVTLKEQTYPVPISRSQLSICVRILRLSPSGDETSANETPIEDEALLTIG